MKPFVSILFFASFYRLASSMPKLEDFYVVQIGFKPPRLDHEVISYETCLSKGKPSVRTISGNFTFHRRVEELGFFITMKRRTTTNNDVNSGTKVPIYNACKQTKYSVEPFFNKFSAKLDENCSVEPGVYSLSNWSLEEHMKKHINKMVLGEFVFYISWLEGKNVIMQHEAYMDFKGLKEKEAEDKMAGSSVKDARNERRNRDHDQTKEKKGKSSRQH